MLQHLRLLCLGLLLTGSSAIGASQQDFASFSHDEALAHSQAAIGNTLDGITLQRSDNSAVSLKEYRGKPLLISMIYTSCHHICPTTTQYLDQVVRKARAALGQSSFNVLSIGFDTANDKPAQMAIFRSSTGVIDANWEFLAGDQAQVEELARQLGFIYYPSPKGFEHLIQTSVVDARGAIYRHVYGIRFPTPLLIEPLKELVFGEPAAKSTLSYLEGRIRLFCTVYDPATDTYHIDISVFIGTFVGLVVSILFGYALVREWRRSIRADR